MFGNAGSKNSNVRPDGTLKPERRNADKANPAGHKLHRKAENIQHHHRYAHNPERYCHQRQ
jgi:hypothetical protein